MTTALPTMAWAVVIRHFRQLLLLLLLRLSLVGSGQTSSKEHPQCFKQTTTAGRSSPVATAVQWEWEAMHVAVAVVMLAAVGIGMSV